MDTLYVGSCNSLVSTTGISNSQWISLEECGLAKQKSSTADRISQPTEAQRNREVDKGKKILDAVKSIALSIDKLQHVTIRFQQSRASLPSMLPPEILKKGMTQSSLFKIREM